MNRARVKRAGKAINRFPYKYEAIDEAYARFLEDGTLPEDTSLSGRVLQRVLDARKKVPEVEAERLALNLYQPYGTTREMLFREACCKVREVRNFARMLLRGMVRAGYDPTDPESVGPEMEPWDFVPVCTRLIGWPHDFVRPEHREQFDRLLRQQAEERAVRPRNSDEWDRGAAKALAAFLTRGVPPTDSRYLAYVMTIADVRAVPADPPPRRRGAARCVRRPRECTGRRTGHSPAPRLRAAGSSPHGGQACALVTNGSGSCRLRSKYSRCVRS
jgi:hypothetical protein